MRGNAARPIAASHPASEIGCPRLYAFSAGVIGASSPPGRADRPFYCARAGPRGRRRGTNRQRALSHLALELGEYSFYIVFYGRFRSVSPNSPYISISEIRPKLGAIYPYAGVDMLRIGRVT